MRSINILFTLGVALTVLGPVVEGSDWPQFRGLNRTGQSEESGWTTKWPKTGPKKKWTAKVGAGYSSISIAKGKVYTIGNQGKKDRVSCFDEKTGTLVWKHEYPCGSAKQYPGTRSTPTVDGDKVYTTSREGHLFCLNTKDGSVVWQKHLVKEFGGKPKHFGLAGSVLIDGEKLYIPAGGKAGLLCLNKSDGKKIWNQGPAKPSFGSANLYTINNKKGLAIATDDLMQGLDIATGKVLWKFSWKTKWGVNAAAPIFVGNQLFISSAYGYGCGLYTIDGVKATETWRNKDMQNHFSSSILEKGHLFGANGDIRKKGSLTCMDWKTGKVKWSHGRSFGALIMVDKKLIVITTKGTLVIAESSPEAYKEIARAQVLGGQCWTPPAFANGAIYCRNTKGDLVCLDVAGK